jgi:hypothetical protein
VLTVNKGRLVLVAASITAPAALLLLIPLALTQLLLQPEFRLSAALGIARFGAIEIGIIWVLYAILIAALILVVKWTLWRRKTVLVLCAAMLCAAVYFKARGETSTEFEGTWEMGFEQSDFFIGGNCARPRYWLHASEDVYSKVSTLGDPREVRIKFVGTSTRMGDYGHLGSIFEKSMSRRSSALSPHSRVSIISWRKIPITLINPLARPRGWAGA